MKKQLLALLMLSLIAAPAYAVKKKDDVDPDKGLYTVLQVGAWITAITAVAGLTASGILGFKNKAIQKEFNLLKKHAELENQDIVKQLMTKYNINSLDELELNKALKKATKAYKIWEWITAAVGGVAFTAYLCTGGCCLCGCNKTIVNCLDKCIPTDKQEQLLGYSKLDD